MDTMTPRTIHYVVIATVLVGLGWTAGNAQTSGPDFEIVVDSPPGETTIHLVSAAGSHRNSHDYSRRQLPTGR